ncbi:hypothetical protein P691DRAFT_786894 [Macrolepiota fuliginosa MF-IS2]|uniref:Uncharacterized protein n=1 Tax=Macrolepiota fuliginosa MF-IS2 TaxID=1400762 RepID=A0A9P5X7N3_9AGAR|nr:hypothetical protein P691DRAFT_786894 [Macrolepiota fuliginosa MF-IS2]
MVLQAKSLSRHADGENAAPTKSDVLATRNFRTSFHAAASRRRARNNGHKSSKYTVEQAKRRSIIKSPANIIRMSFPVNPRAPSPVADVEMKDASPPTQSTTIPITFPLFLGRPEYVEVPRKSIEAVDPELAKTDVNYIQDTLMASTMGPSMYQVLRRYTAKDKDLLSRGTLPREISIIVEDMASVLPTHMMAIHGPAPKNPSDNKTKITLFPVHSLILATHCAKLPPFPPTNETSSKVDPSTREIELPVRPLFLHSPKTFPLLLEYLYLKRTEVLLRHMIPIMLPVSLINQPDQHESFARVLGTKFTVQGLIQHMTIVHGMWQNACALGVFDDELWGAMDFAWKLLLMSLAVSTGKPETLESIKDAVAALEVEQEPSKNSKTDRHEPPSSSRNLGAVASTKHQLSPPLIIGPMRHKGWGAAPEKSHNTRRLSDWAEEMVEIDSYYGRTRCNEWGWKKAKDRKSMRKLRERP